MWLSNVSLIPERILSRCPPRKRRMFSGLFSAARGYRYVLPRQMMCSRRMRASHAAAGRIMAQNQSQPLPLGQFVPPSPQVPTPRVGSLLDEGMAVISPLFDQKSTLVGEEVKEMFSFDKRLPIPEEVKEHPVLESRVAGVSFEDRQEILASLKDCENPPVILEHESLNPHDPNAVKVSLFDGRQLGYVPRTDLHFFGKRNVAFGRIVHVGASKTGFYGALIHTQPSKPSFTLTCVPAELFYFKKLLDRLRRERQKAWKAVENIDPDDLRCEITGISGKLDVTVTERWESSLDRPIMNLQGLKQMCKVLVDLERTPLDLITVEDCKLLAAANRWSLQEAVDYLNLCKATKSSLPGSKLWVISISLLAKQGLFKRFPMTYMDQLKIMGGSDPSDHISDRYNFISDSGRVTLLEDISPPSDLVATPRTTLDSSNMDSIGE